MKTAKLIRKAIPGYHGIANLYEVYPPVAYGYDEPEGETSYIIVSAAHTIDAGPETYIFPANEQGAVIDWFELPGSFRGDLDHDRALQQAGYEIIK